MEEFLDKKEEGKEKTISPYEYFQKMKGKLQTMDDERLEKVYKNAIYLAERYNKTGQTKGLRKLRFHIESIVKERQILDAGISKFVYRSDIEEYIQDVADKQVVILDLKSYERNLPDEIIEALEKVNKRVEYVTFDENKKEGTYVRYPERNELNMDINESLIVEFYNK